MCLLCTDADELDDNLPEVEMAEPWEPLKDEVLALFKEGVQEVASELKPAAQAFLEDIAIQGAKEKWRALNAPDPNERAVAESNLRHLRGQAVAEAKKQQLAVTSWAEGLLRKTLDVALGFLVKVGPKLLAGA